MRNHDLIRCVWTGKALEPCGNFAAAQLRDRLGAGQIVSVDIDPDRTAKSHNHQFAFVRTAWENLPESLMGAPYAANPDTLRKHAMIATGFCHTEMIAVGSSYQAERVAASVSAIARRMHGYALTVTEGPVVYCHTPMSQKQKEMGAEAFQASKQAILEWLARLIDVNADDLAKMGRKQPA